MRHIPDLRALIDVAPDSTVSRTALRGQGARVVLFAFDKGQELTEHTAAVPILLQVLDGSLRITADGQSVLLAPGGLIHIDARAPHAVTALEPSRMALIMLDPRVESAEAPA